MRFQAETIFDMATLTGAQAYLTGRLHGAVLSNTEEWERSVRFPPNLSLFSLFSLDHRCW